MAQIGRFLPLIEAGKALRIASPVASWTGRAAAISGGEGQAEIAGDVFEEIADSIFVEMAAFIFADARLPVQTASTVFAGK